MGGGGGRRRVVVVAGRRGGGEGDGFVVREWGLGWGGCGMIAFGRVRELLRLRAREGVLYQHGMRMSVSTHS